MNPEALQQDTETQQKAALWAAMQERKFSIHNPPEKPVPLLKLADQTICTPGNISNLQGAAKSAKSAAMGGMIAALLQQGATVTSFQEESVRDTLGFTSEPGEGNIVHLDTEQSDYDHHINVVRAFRRAGVQQDAPNFHSFSLVDVSTAERRAALELCLENLAPVRAVFVDGIADLLIDPNDPAESFSLVDYLHQTAVRHHCAIVTVLHENPGGGETGKTRGHLGSQLERKAESNIRVAKDKDGISTIFIEKGRHCYIPQQQGYCFQWDDESGMHRSMGQRNRVLAERAEGRKAEKEDAEVDKWTAILREAFPGGGSRGAIKDEFMRVGKVAKATAFRKIDLLVQSGVLIHASDGSLILSAMDEPLDGPAE
jgi:hypothetical protein